MYAISNSFEYRGTTKLSAINPFSKYWYCKRCDVRRTKSAKKGAEYIYCRDCLDILEDEKNENVS